MAARTPKHQWEDDHQRKPPGLEQQFMPELPTTIIPRSDAGSAFIAGDSEITLS